MLQIAASSRALGADLRWTASAGCFERDHALEEIARLLDRPLAEVEGVEFAVTVRPDEGEKLHVSIVAERVGTGPRTRELSADTCEEAADAAALAIAMAVTSGEPGPEPAAPIRVNQGTPTNAEPTGPTQQRPAASTRADAWRASLGVFAVIDHGALPSVTGGAEGTLSLGRGSFKLTALGAYLAPRTAELADGRGGEFSLLLGGLLGCAERNRGSLLLRACAGGELGKLRGQGIGLNDPRVGSAFWRALRAQAAFGWELVPDVRLIAEFALVLPIARPTFLIGGEEPVHRVSSVTERGVLGVEFAL